DQATVGRPVPADGLLAGLPGSRRGRQDHAAAVALQCNLVPAVLPCLLAPTSACSPDVSQKRVRVRSTTSVAFPNAAEVSRAVRGPSAFVMSISSGASTTGTPLTIS